MKKKADDRMHDLELKFKKIEDKRQKAIDNFNARNREIEEDSYSAFG